MVAKSFFKSMTMNDDYGYGERSSPPISSALGTAIVDEKTAAHSIVHYYVAYANMIIIA